MRSLGVQAPPPAPPLPPGLTPAAAGAPVQLMQSGVGLAEGAERVSSQQQLGARKAGGSCAGPALAPGTAWHSPLPPASPGPGAAASARASWGQGGCLWGPRCQPLTRGPATPRSPAPHRTPHPPSPPRARHTCGRPCTVPTARGAGQGPLGPRGQAGLGAPVAPSCEAKVGLGARRQGCWGRPPPLGGLTPTQETPRLRPLLPPEARRPEPWHSLPAAASGGKLCLEQDPEGGCAQPAGGGGGSCDQAQGRRVHRSLNLGTKDAPSPRLGPLRPRPLSGDAPGRPLRGWESKGGVSRGGGRLGPGRAPPPLPPGSHAAPLPPPLPSAVFPGHHPTSRPPDLGDASPPSPRGWAHLEGGPALGSSRGACGPGPSSAPCGAGPAARAPERCLRAALSRAPHLTSCCASISCISLSHSAVAITASPTGCSPRGVQTLPGWGVRRASAAPSLPPGVSTHHELGRRGSRAGAASRPPEPGASSGLSSRASQGLFTDHDPFSPTHLRVLGNMGGPQAATQLGAAGGAPSRQQRTPASGQGPAGSRRALPPAPTGLRRDPSPPRSHKPAEPPMKDTTTQSL